MEPPPSTSAATAARDDGGPMPIDGAQEAVASTSGSVGVQQEKEIIISKASVKQCYQLFGDTCRINLQRCDAAIPPPIPAVSRIKAEEDKDSDSDSTGSSSEEEELKVFASPREPAPSTSKSTVAAIPSSSGAPAVSGPNAKIKTEEESDAGRSSSEEDDQVQRIPAPSAPSSTKKKAVTKKKTAAKKVSQQKSPVHCTVCKMKINSSHLKAHMRKHSGEKRYKCDKCGRSFWSRSTFSTHKKARDQRNGLCPRGNNLSGGWRPKGGWKCKVCGKSLKAASGYERHMRSHRGEKHFKCEECGKGFVRNGELSQHKRIHNEGWQYTCVFCEKGFNQQSNYWDHLRGHTEEKPYFCVVEGCGASFRQLGPLKYHRQKIHLKKY